MELCLALGSTHGSLQDERAARYRAEAGRIAHPWFYESELIGLRTRLQVTHPCNASDFGHRSPALDVHLVRDACLPL